MTLPGKRGAPMERRFRRELDSLDRIFEFTAAFVKAESLPESEAFALDFVIEELFTNMIRHQPGAAGDVTISVARDHSSLVIRLMESGVEYFDITKAADVDVTRPIGERTPGGLGIYLTRKFVDKIDYAYSHGKAVVTLTKHLRG